MTTHVKIMLLMNKMVLSEIPKDNEANGDTVFNIFDRTETVQNIEL